MSCAPCLGVRGCILTVSMEEVVPRATLKVSVLGMPRSEESCFDDFVAEVTFPLRCLELIKRVLSEVGRN